MQWELCMTEELLMQGRISFIGWPSNLGGQRFYENFFVAQEITFTNSDDERCLIYELYKYRPTYTMKFYGQPININYLYDIHAE